MIGSIALGNFNCHLSHSICHWFLLPSLGQNGMLFGVGNRHPIWKNKKRFPQTQTHSVLSNFCWYFKCSCCYSNICETETQGSLHPFSKIFSKNCWTSTDFINSNKSFPHPSAGFLTLVLWVCWSVVQRHGRQLILSESAKSCSLTCYRLPESLITPRPFVSFPFIFWSLASLQ